MKLVKILFVLVGVLLVPAIVLANGCPGSVGGWDSNSGMDIGRAVTSQCNGINLAIGDLLEAQSWDGSTLGGQWVVSDVVVSNVVYDYTNFIGGSGYISAAVTYSGGIFSLDPTGPWGIESGSDNIDGVMDTGAGTVTAYYTGGVNYSTTSTVNGTGHVTSCGDISGCVVEYAFSLSHIVWEGDPQSGGYFPNYPAFPECSNPPTTLGSQWDMDFIGMSLDCAVPTDPISWDSMKALYK